MHKGMRLGVGGERLQPCKLGDAGIIPTEISGVNIVTGDGSPEKLDNQPPAAVLSSSKLDKRKAFLRCGTKFQYTCVQYILMLKIAFGLPKILILLEI